MSYISDPPLLYPTNIDSNPNQSLPLDQIHSWKSKGFCLVNGLFPLELIDQARLDLESMSNSKPYVEDFGGFPFPFKSDALNEIALNPRILRIARELLGGEILLNQAEAWEKRSSTDIGNNPFKNQDQRMHMDYPNHYLTHPSSWDDPEVVAMIVYLDDVDECGGSTAVVERLGDSDELYLPPYVNMPGVGAIPWINDRTLAEKYFLENNPSIYEFRQKLYAREKSVQYNKGSVLFYRLDVWHRGTPINPGKTRNVINLGFKKTGCTWITCWEPGWATNAYDNLWGLIPTLDEDQRAALGIPRGSDLYWSKGRNQDNFAARYKDHNKSLNK
eukprot:gene8344-11288_t